MTYTIEFKKSAQKELAKLNPDATKRIAKVILALSKDPRSGRVRPMVNSRHWRLRVADYRIIYTIYDKILVIEIVKIGHRSKVYKKP